MIRCPALLICLVVGLTFPAAARQADYLSRLEADIVREHNLARENPGQYATYLEALREFFNGRLLELPGEIALRTEEGVRAVDEAIRFLRRAQPIGPVTPSRGMSRGARDHVRDSGPRGRTGDVGTDGSHPWDRVNRYGSWLVTMGENIAYGRYDPSDARQVVVQLIIDDGVRSRGHRDNIFDLELHVIGVSCGEHKTFGSICVMVYAGGYEER
jgi:uncharacterized protein YkwD